MPPLVKQVVNVQFGNADQKTTSKAVTLGRPTVAENVFQSKTRSYRKRGGFAPIDRLTDSGSITTGADLAFDGTVPILRTADAVYARPASLWLNRGSYKPVIPSQEAVSAGRATHPLLVVVGTQNWNFVQGSDLKWYYSVTDSGVEVVAPTLVSAMAYFWGKAVSSTGAVWLFAGPPSGGGNGITLYKFLTAAPATAPTSTAFAAPTGVSVDAFDVIDAQANGNGIVAAIASVDAAGIAFGGGSFPLFFGRLNTANGLVDGTGWVGDATYTVGQFRTPSAWVKTGQSATTLHYLSRRSTNNHTMLTAVTAATLVSATADLGAPVLNGGFAGSVTGYRVAATGDIVIFATDGSAGFDTATIVKATWNGAALTSNGVVARARTTVGDPFLIGTTAYLVCLWSAGTAHDLQDAYYVIDTTTAPGRVVARTLYGLGSLLPSQLGDGVGSFTNVWAYSWVCPVVLSGSVASILVGSFVSNVWTLIKLSFDFAPTASTIGPPLVTQDGALVAFPGGWPMGIAGGGQMADVTPGMFPDAAFAVPWTVTQQTASSTLGAGTYLCTACYAIVDAKGNVQRSVPAPVQSVTIVAGKVIRFANVPTLRTGNTGAARVFVEFYTSVADEETLFLVKRVANDPTVDVMADVDINIPVRDGSEILYTDGGAIEHISVPPFTWAAAWRGRIFVGGTDEPGAVVWPSFELTPGFGPAFNETLRFRLPDGSGKDTAGCPIDFNYFAIFKPDSVWLISGAGPDGLGNGSYGGTVQQVPDAPGCVNPRSVVQTPLGAMYQARNGEIWLITTGGSAQRIGDCWNDHKGATATAAIHSPHFSWVLFFTDSGKALVWDYGNPLPGESSGQGYVWNLPAAAVAAATVGGDLRYLDATGVVRAYDATRYYDDTSTPILKKVKAPLTLGGLRGYQRLYRGQVVGQWVSTHSLKVTVDNFAGVAGETGSSAQNWTKAVSAGPELMEFRPTAQRATAMDVTVEDAGADLTEGASLDGFALEIGIKSGMPRLPVTSRM